GVVAPDGLAGGRSVVNGRTRVCQVHSVGRDRRGAVPTGGTDLPHCRARLLVERVSRAEYNAVGSGYRGGVPVRAREKGAPEQLTGIRIKRLDRCRGREGGADDEERLRVVGCVGCPAQDDRPPRRGSRRLIEGEQLGAAAGDRDGYIDLATHDQRVRRGASDIDAPGGGGG